MGIRGLKSKRVPLLAIGIFAVVGVVLLSASWALVSVVSFDAEDSTLNGAKVVADANAFGGSALQFSANSVANKKVAIIGDSLTYQNGSGVTNIKAKYVAAGYNAANIFVYGVGGKGLVAADTSGKTTVQNIGEARTQLGTVDAWVIALGTNNISDTDSQFVANVNTVLNTIGATDKVVWIGLGFYGVSNTNAARINPLLTSTIATHSNTSFANWNSYIHNGRDETGLWVYPTDSTHMTDAGYAIRNDYYVAQTPAGTAAATGIVASTKYFMKDGQQFYPKGFNSIGLLQPDNCPRKKSVATTAADNYNVTELNAIKNTFHGNIIRFQVSQKGLDPQDSELSAGLTTYLNKIKAGVALAQANGVQVILSMQEQVYACGYAHPLPNSATVRAWQTLAPAFKDNPYIIFELYNEPQNDTTAAGWTQWRNGGATPLSNAGTDGSVYDVVGHQTLVNTIRGLGANNVLLADGANYAGQLNSLYTSASSNYLLTDTLPSSQIGYAIHPYYFHIAANSTLATDTANWTPRFLYLRDTSKIAADKQFPMIATEWNSTSQCNAGQATRTVEFLDILRSNEIGMTAHAIDIPDRLVIAVPGWQPNNFTTGGTECGAGSGAGEALQAFYNRN